MNELQTLLNRISGIVAKNNQILDATGGRFNIFQIIGVTADETRLHSAFINELLNVKGTHGLGDKFLELFIIHCLDNDFDFQTSSSTSIVEFSIGPITSTTGGRIDIIVRDNKNQSIIIENKIYAGDQECQMLRYSNCSRNFTNSRLIYLTLDGSSPSIYSTGIEPIDYKTISYKYEILNWLTNCKQIAVDFPLVREAISHYINLIKHLTNTSIMAEINNGIIELVMKPENIKSAFELGKVLTDVKIKIQWEFWKQLKLSLEEMGVLVKGEENQDNVKESMVIDYYKPGAKNKPDYYGLWKEIPVMDGIKLEWGCVVQNNIYVGFRITKENTTFYDSNSEIFRTYRQIIKSCDELYKTDSDYWLAWKHIDPMLNFRDFNTQSIYDLADASKLKTITDQIAKQALDDLNRVKAKLTQAYPV